LAIIYLTLLDAGMSLQIFTVVFLTVDYKRLSGGTALDTDLQSKRAILQDLLSCVFPVFVCACLVVPP
jgi:hypothetical protein